MSVVKLKVGDVLFAENRYDVLGKVLVVRTTRTQAILNNGKRLRIEFDGWAKAIGFTSWDSVCYRATSPELEAKHHRQIMEARFLGIKVKNLPTPILSEILELLNRSAESATQHNQSHTKENQWPQKK